MLPLLPVLLLMHSQDVATGPVLVLGGDQTGSEMEQVVLTFQSGRLASNWKAVKVRAGHVLVHDSVNKAVYLTMQLDLLTATLDKDGKLASFRLNDLPEKSRELFKATIANPGDEMSRTLLSLKNPTFAVGSQNHMVFERDGKQYSAMSRQYEDSKKVENVREEDSAISDEEIKRLVALKPRTRSTAFVPTKHRAVKPSIIDGAYSDCFKAMSEDAEKVESEYVAKWAMIAQKHGLAQFPNLDKPTGFHGLPSDLRNRFQGPGTDIDPLIGTSERNSPDFWNSVSVLGFRSELVVTAAVLNEAGRTPEGLAFRRYSIKAFPFP